jgi:CRISPR-associated endoribonuclease Cas6
MPTALIFTLRPVARAVVEGSLGRATHAALLALIADRDPALAAALHAEQRVRPLTVSPILGLETGPSAVTNPARRYWLRATLLNTRLEHLSAEWATTAPGQLAIGGVLWQVEQVTSSSAAHQWAGTIAYEQLMADVLRQGGTRGPARWRFEFATPVMFRQRSRCLPLPEPALVFGSLLDRWNALAPLPLPPEVREFAETALVVNNFALNSVAVAGKGGVPQIGAVGSCCYTVTTRDRHLETCIEVLARWAFYSGVGAGTARGFGQTRLCGVQHGRREGERRHGAIA